jgi:glucose dehydrogenase
MTKVAHVWIPVIDAKPRGPEEVEVEPLGGDRYRVLCPSRFAYGLAVGDEIEIDETSRFGFRTLRRSGNLTVWFYAPARGAEQSLAAAARDLVEELGATIEGTPERMMIVTVPLAVGWQRIEVVMNGVAATAPGTTWEYANVYDPIDGKTPLNWWRHG